MHLMKFFAFFALFVLPSITWAATQDSATTAPHAFFKNVKDGDTVTSPVTVKFGISGMKIAPAGDMTAGTGHFHLLVDTALTEEQKRGPIPKDDQHLHFGKGQTETTLELKPGKHTLQIVMGDGAHMLHNPSVMSDMITVIAK